MLTTLMVRHCVACSMMLPLGMAGLNISALIMIHCFNIIDGNNIAVDCFSYRPLREIRFRHGHGQGYPPQYPPQVLHRGEDAQSTSWGRPSTLSSMASGKKALLLSWVARKEKRERLCRYIARPAVAVSRLSLSSTRKVLYTLKARGSRRPTGMGRPRWSSIGQLSALYSSTMGGCELFDD
jgi:Putative transposase